MNFLTQSCKSGKQHVSVFPIVLNSREGVNFLGLMTNIRMFSKSFFVSVEVLPL